MTRGRYYSTVMPIWGVLYVIGLIVFASSAFTVVGALVFAVLAVLGTVVIKPDPTSTRSRNRARNRGR